MRDTAAGGAVRNIPSRIIRVSSDGDWSDEPATWNGVETILGLSRAAVTEAEVPGRTSWYLSWLRQGTSVPMHAVQDDVFMTVQSGPIVLVLPRDRVELDSGSCIVLAPGAPHGWATGPYRDAVLSVIRARREC